MPELCPFQTVPFGRCLLPPPHMETELAVDKEITILSHIAQGEHVRQRDLSHVIGMSLGMTNTILKRLVHKGYLTVRKVNNRNIAYAGNPRGGGGDSEAELSLFQADDQEHCLLP